MNTIINDSLASGMVKQGYRSLDARLAGNTTIFLPGTPSASRSKNFRIVVENACRVLKPFSIAVEGTGKQKVWWGFCADLTKGDLDLGICIISVPFRDPFDFQITHSDRFASRHCHQRMIQTLRTASLHRLGKTLFMHILAMIEGGFDSDEVYKTFRHDGELLIWHGAKAATCIGVDRLDKHQPDYERLLAGKPVANAILIPNGRAT